MLSATPTPTPTSLFLNSLFPRCTTTHLLRQLHGQLILHGLHLSTVLATRLTSFYFAASSPDAALKVFDQIPHKTTRSWNTILSAFSRLQPASDFLPLYRLARADSLRPDSFSLVFAIRTLTALPSLHLGTSVHAESIRSGLDTHEHILTALITMYLELGSLNDAEKVLDGAPIANPAPWSAMMKGYLHASMDLQVFNLHECLKDLGVELDARAAVCLARSCGNFACAKEGRAIHALSIKKNYLNSNVYLQTALVDMYGKSGFVFGDQAMRLFEEMECRDVVSWSSVISCLVRSGRAYESLRQFHAMVEDSVMPNEVTVAGVLLACAHLGALQQGKSVHGFIVRHEVGLDVVTYTALLDMYAKCGAVDSSYKVFDTMPERNVFSWSAMIGGFGLHGMCLESLALFERMRSENVKPNAVTFVSVLSACSHSGMVQEGCGYFESMSREYKINPNNEHYTCMVDLLGRAGLIDEAESLVREMPIEPAASVWGALLVACRIHKKVELAQEVAEKLYVLEPDRPNTHILVANIYAAAEMWDMVKKMREVLHKRGLKKTVGFSTIEVDKRLYIFEMIRKVDAESKGITELWRRLSNQMETLGYTPDISFKLLDVNYEEREEMVLCGHSEKLALAFGLLKTKDGTPLRITKNLRVCGDCHNATKFVSLITKREIVIRDSKRFHHFKDGVCSCDDYW